MGGAINKEQLGDLLVLSDKHSIATYALTFICRCNGFRYVIAIVAANTITCR